MRIHLGEAHMDSMENEMSQMLEQIFPDQTSKCEKCGKMFEVKYQKTEHLIVEHPWPILIDLKTQEVVQHTTYNIHTHIARASCSEKVNTED